MRDDNRWIALGRQARRIWDKTPEAERMDARTFIELALAAVRDGRPIPSARTN